MEYTLDPQDWEQMKQLGHRMLDDMFDHLRTVRDRKAWQELPQTVVTHLQEPLPQAPQNAAAVYESFTRNVLPYDMNNIHPRFWGWVQGGGTPFGMLADMLASGMNANVGLGNIAPIYVERQVLDWSKELFGFPSTASGILTSGASIANITALVVARNHLFDGVKQRGLRAVDGQLRIYGSAETHNCVVKGIEVIGIGADNFRKAPVGKDYRVDTKALHQMIREDRAAGYIPFCVIGNAGAVNTGAIDDLEALAAIAKEEGCWFHVDGAFGAIPRLLPVFKEKMKGMELADSLSFDFHKWLYVNYEVGCLLVRDEAAHRMAFASNVSYLVQHERGPAAGPTPFSTYGMELSRGFKALKVWMLLKEHGVQEYARQVQQNLDQAAYLGTLVNQTEELELLADVTLNIVCYRFNPNLARASAGSGDVLIGEQAGKGMAEEELNALNKELLMRLQEQGIALPTSTVLGRRYAIRAAITNHRSRKEDFELLIKETVRIGKEICREKAQQAPEAIHSSH